MIVADASALLSLAAGDSLGVVLAEFDVHATTVVTSEIEATTEYDDEHADAARTVLEARDRLSVHCIDEPGVMSSRVDAGEASCASLLSDIGAEFLITDDLRALPELQSLVDAKVAISPIVLRALVERGVLEADDARERVETIAERRDWLGAPIFRRAEALFEDIE
ncbi:hypothetical protein SAMN06269185_2012 [Natronoarchaeum philippinense]|uniref:PIN domain-containing protein n=1 Tax=Natronoarchaeum philippinense TaxID=558529 RepID=A0A285NUU1_NATPI|nr:hypothetical protein [Natronoarchaeum philippinense]SNZ13008.1 hypothetical protein SAMN06269185_2012 [Natronoarchaeum philippinense]